MSKPIRVVHISSAHKDGDVRIFHKECVSLAEAGYDVFLVIPNAVSRIERGVNIVSFQTKKQGRFYRTTKIVNRVFEEAEKLNGDIYHLHDPELLRISKKFKRLGKKVIYDAHEDLPRQIMSKAYIPGFLRKIISWFTEKFENRIVRKLDGVITATPFIRDRFLKIHPNVTDVKNLPLVNELTVIKSDVSNRKVCYVGGLNKVRGVYELVQCLDQCSAQLILAGDFEDDHFKNKLFKHPNWKYVDYRGYLNREQIKQVFADSAVGMVTLHPMENYLDALPVKLFEYMAAGIPVISSDFPLWKSIVENSDCGICVDPLSPQRIAEAVNKILADKERAKQMGENGREAVMKIYNWNFEKETLIKFYKSLVANV